ncbi:MAG TPA: PfkB family carbohydrate kinase [Phenylobacterium sp.]|nr:PfkB family carbohydrate kinase [Phenylobacterium sp.]
MAGPVVVAGEALVDLVPGADGDLSPLVGGGPFNTARALGRLGQPTVFLGSLSGDPLGRRLADALAADGVAAPLRTGRPTSLALAELDAQGRASYRFYFAGTSAEALEPAEAVAALPPDAAALHVGSLGLVLRPLADAVEALVGRVAGRALVMIDPNVRPSMIEDRASYDARLARLVAQADVVKVSDEDLQVLAPGPPPRAAARALLDRGPRLVLLTLGADGAVAFGAFGEVTAAAPQMAVVDTIGAGDTFSGAWLARWLQLGRPLDDAQAVRDAAAFACRAAALCCARAGASPPTSAELAAFAA